MAVWNWYMTRAMRERIAIIAAVVIVVVFVIGTISSLTDEDEDDDDDMVADDDPPYSINPPETPASGQGAKAITT
ncbi:MAG: hypothetical protein AB7U18_22625 [Dehalococcoidia bacterium]